MPLNLIKYTHVLANIESTTLKNVFTAKRNNVIDTLNNFVCPSIFPYFIILKTFLKFYEGVKRSIEMHFSKNLANPIP